MLSTTRDYIETAPRPDVEIIDDTAPAPTSPPGSRPVFVMVLAAALVAMLAAAAWYITSSVTVEVSVDGVAQPVETRADTVAELLDGQGIVVSGDDLVVPSPETELLEGTTVEIRYARPLTLTVDGVETVHTSTELSVGAALAAVGAPVDGSAVSIPLDRALPRSGAAVVIVTPKSVTLDDGGRTRTITSTDATVGDLLAGAGITVGENDRLVPSPDSRVAEAMTVTITRIRVETEVRTEPIAHDTTERSDAELTVGTRRTETEGVDGSKDVTYELTYTNDELTSEEAIETVVTSEPVTEVVRVGTKPAPVQPAASPGASAGGAATGLNWAALAQCESSGNPRAVNPAGYYGLYQFSLRTWASVGGSGNPVDASVAEQTNRAQILYNKAGAGQWPHCGKYLFS
ncbi:MAG: ubiquitin-like domain-containing protein [Acidimicrobiia bacterium]|nr:ubiquitin-like domain-containing protein [Acidimicrobiia bacterium]